MFDVKRRSALVLLGALCALFCAEAKAQPPSPPLPDPIPPPAGVVAGAVAASGPREAELEDEVRELKAMVRDLSGRVEELSGALSTRMPPVPPPADGAPTPSAAAVPGAGTSGMAAGGGAYGPQEASRGGRRIERRGPRAVGPEAAEPRGSRCRASRSNFPATSIFGPGFQMQTTDTEFTFQFHDLTQVDGRFYTQGQQVPVTSTFLIPREWLIFSGRLTKPFEYYLSIAEGIDSLNILDVFGNVNFDERFQVKIGRYKTPFTYEFYGLPINGFITPERSLFFNNFGLNRDIGLMAWGSMFDSRFNYAAGIFNGTRNGFVDSNDFKDFAGLVDFRPFGNWTDHWLENFSFGGSTDTGLENGVPIPQVFRTNVATTGNLAIGPEFLALNNNVRESGLRAFWSTHMAY